MDKIAAESLAKKTWFDFERQEVASKYHGDWLAFHQAKLAEDEALTAQAMQTEHIRDRYLPKTAQQVRARRVLQEEFEKVAKTKATEIVVEARRVLLALARGEVEAVADSCILYDPGPNRRQLTLDFLNAHKEELRAAAKTFDDKDFGKSLHFDQPDPSTGQVGKVHVAFGPMAKRPANAKPGSYPSRSEIELWWVGQVMPEPNGSLYPSPHPGVPSPGQWRFHRLTTPYSIVDYGRE